MVDLPTANLWRRLAAMIYDSLVLMAVAMAYGALFLSIKHTLLGIELGEGEKANLGEAGFVGLVLVLEGFYWFFWCRGGQTLGMRAWRIQVRNVAGGPVQITQALVRGLVGPFSFALAGMGYFWALIDKEGRSWHDAASQTHVVQLPKPEKKKPSVRPPQ
ncbi:RDD family protein [Pseudomaricurvus alkylphenolicus]|uniref:RDD family protein n=1 Tax=Pseudomaricurvus alkylphenolicus TaxID=1306991 RepID=UPI0014234568|nr:RDD family protein [Pseudomaricurvus alkylphenolicus]NIB41538.1 RDD family protein [Pseudomaricurvus alkylphenolicus]